LLTASHLVTTNNIQTLFLNWLSSTQFSISSAPATRQLLHRILLPSSGHDEYFPPLPNGALQTNKVLVCTGLI
jgi:hypothetical protein